MSEEKKTEWFASWFDSPYYHQLYSHRDETEAAQFIKKLCNFLNLKKGAFVLDLACGKGRHSRTLASLGFNTIGVDLSPESIKEANKNSSDSLSFDVHDMREVYGKRPFDAVMNLFTSFGYFDDESHNLKMLTSIHQMLKVDGVFVLDFFNAVKVKETSLGQGSCYKNTVHFSWNKEIIDKKVVKTIAVKDGNSLFHFREQVQLFELSDFQRMFDATHLQIITTFGDFNLNPFDEKTSDRLIIIAKKHA